jgi:hypothetical protein
VDESEAAGKLLRMFRMEAEVYPLSPQDRSGAPRLPREAVPLLDAIRTAKDARGRVAAEAG